MRYNKLVRDNVPDIIKQKGGNPVFRIADDQEFWEKLKEKLLEEVNEFLENSTTEEAADILEVLEAMCEYKRITPNTLAQVKEKKAQEKGLFLKKIILEEA